MLNGRCWDCQCMLQVHCAIALCFPGPLSIRVCNLLNNLHAVLLYWCAWRVMGAVDKTTSFCK